MTGLPDPPALVIGVGTTTGAPVDELQALLRDVLATNGLENRPVAVVATIDRRRDEPAVVALASKLGARVVSFTADELSSVQTSSPMAVGGVSSVPRPGVCEPAAILASGGGTLVVAKARSAHTTVAVATRAVQSNVTRVDRPV